MRSQCWLGVVLLPAVFVLNGCGFTAQSAGGTGVTSSAQISGSVHGGQQPVSGATIQLYAVGTAGDGSASTALLTQTVTSSSNGSFSITGLYPCTSGAMVYITATGGNPGLSAANPNLAMMTALGPCSALTPGTVVSVNEVTTVAAVSALAPFMTSLTAIGSSASDAAALAAAFSVASELADPSAGVTPGNNIPTGTTVPSALINTLANIVSACINSTGGG